jgi:hypothetical protein
MATEAAYSSNPYENRWRWWYTAISDWMIRNPGKHMKDCAAELQKHPNTISMITNTDMFREYHSQRQAEWRERHDFGLRQKLTMVADKSLDILLDQLDKKQDQIPIGMVKSTVTDALDRLGYLPSAQSGPAVNVNIDNSQKAVTVQVSANDLAEARMAMRQAEESRRGSSLGPPANSLPTHMQQQAPDLLEELGNPAADAAAESPRVEAEPDQGLVIPVEEEGLE